MYGSTARTKKNIVFHTSSYENPCRKLVVRYNSRLTALLGCAVSTHKHVTGDYVLSLLLPASGLAWWPGLATTTGVQLEMHQQRNEERCDDDCEPLNIKVGWHSSTSSATPLRWMRSRWLGGGREGNKAECPHYQHLLIRCCVVGSSCPHFANATIRQPRSEASN